MISPRAGVALAAIAVLFSGDLVALFKQEQEAKDATAPAPGQEAVDRLSIGGKVHISFCSS